MEFHPNPTNEWRTQLPQANAGDFGFALGTSVFQLPTVPYYVASGWERPVNASGPARSVDGQFDYFGDYLTIDCKLGPRIPGSSELKYIVCPFPVEIPDLSAGLLSEYGLNWHGGISFEHYSPIRWAGEPCPIPSGSPDASFGQGPSFGHYESLASFNVSIPRNQSRQKLVQLLDARAKLNAFELQIQTYLKFFAFPSVFEYWGEQRTTGCELTTEEALEFFNRNNPRSRVLAGNEVLYYVLHGEQALEALSRYRERARHLRVKISSKILSLKRLLAGILGRYCGLSWARRYWFLMHGSHPPKPEDWQFDSQFFGCARASAF